MNVSTASYAILALLGWGIGSFIAKLATNRIGTRSFFFDLLGYAVTAAIFSIVMFKPTYIYSTEKVGAFLGFIAGATGAFGGIAFYYLLTKKDASMAVPLTALYPALTVLLAILFLRESITLTKVLGILFSLVAIFLLSL